MITCFCTYVSDELYFSYGADKLVRSAKYFYPDIPFVVYGSKDIEEVLKKEIPIESMQPFFMAATKHGAKRVIYFDADSMITGKMDELFEALNRNQVVCVRNNNDYGKAGKSDPLTQSFRDKENYLNAGLVATCDNGFLIEWLKWTTTLGNDLPFGSQSVLNVVTIDYTTHLLDKIESPVYYGVSALSGTLTHWDSWKEITLNETGELILNNKKVKVLHHGGGFTPNKLGFEMFSDQVRERLEEIVK